jgi:hypothetical protein
VVCIQYVSECRYIKNRNTEVYLRCGDSEMSFLNWDLCVSITERVDMSVRVLLYVFETGEKRVKTTKRTKKTLENGIRDEDCSRCVQKINGVYLCDLVSMTSLCWMRRTWPSSRQGYPWP